MAEIPIEPRRRSKRWVWVLVAIVVLAALGVAAWWYLTLM